MTKLREEFLGPITVIGAGSATVDASGARITDAADPIANTDLTTKQWVLANSLSAGRYIYTTSPLTGGGDLSADRTIALSAGGTANRALVTTDGSTTSWGQVADAMISSLSYSKLTGVPPVVTGLSSVLATSNTTDGYNISLTNGDKILIDGVATSYIIGNYDFSSEFPSSYPSVFSGTVNVHVNGGLLQMSPFSGDGSNFSGYINLSTIEQFIGSAGGGNAGILSLSPSATSPFDIGPYWGSPHLDNYYHGYGAGIGIKLGDGYGDFMGGSFTMYGGDHYTDSTFSVKDGYGALWYTIPAGGTNGLQYRDGWNVVQGMIEMVPLRRDPPTLGQSSAVFGSMLYSKSISGNAYGPTPGIPVVINELFWKRQNDTVEQITGMNYATQTYVDGYFQTWGLPQVLNIHNYTGGNPIVMTTTDKLQFANGYFQDNGTINVVTNTGIDYRIYTDHNIIAGSNSNISGAAHSIIAGGDGNNITVSGDGYNVIGGGAVNTITNATYSVIAGGSHDTITGPGSYNFMGAVFNSNITTSSGSFIGATTSSGSSNITNSTASLIGVTEGGSYISGSDHSVILAGSPSSYIANSTRCILPVGGASNHISDSTDCFLGPGLNPYIEHATMVFAGTVNSLGAGNISYIDNAFIGNAAGGSRFAGTSSYRIQHVFAGVSDAGGGFVVGARPSYEAPQYCGIIVSRGGTITGGSNNILGFGISGCNLESSTNSFIGIGKSGDSVYYSDTVFIGVSEAGGSIRNSTNIFAGQFGQGTIDTSTNSAIGLALFGPGINNIHGCFIGTVTSGAGITDSTNSFFGAGSGNPQILRSSYAFGGALNSGANITDGYFSFMGGGSSGANINNSTYAFMGVGYNGTNITNSNYSVLMSGDSGGSYITGSTHAFAGNLTNSSYIDTSGGSAIVTGNASRITYSANSFIGSGYASVIDGYTAGVNAQANFIGSGHSQNITNQNYSAIISGNDNHIFTDSGFGSGYTFSSFIGAGSYNTIHNSAYSSIIGGYTNTISASDYSIIGGGIGASINSSTAIAVLMGAGPTGNIDSSQHSVISYLGSSSNTITGSNGFKYSNIGSLLGGLTLGDNGIQYSSIGYIKQSVTVNQGGIGSSSIGYIGSGSTITSTGVQSSSVGYIAGSTVKNVTNSSIGRIENATTLESQISGSTVGIISSGASIAASGSGIATSSIGLLTSGVAISTGGVSYSVIGIGYNGGSVNTIGDSFIGMTKACTVDTVNNSVLMGVDGTGGGTVQTISKSFVGIKTANGGGISTLTQSFVGIDGDSSSGVSSASDSFIGVIYNGGSGSNITNSFIGIAANGGGISSSSDCFAGIAYNGTTISNTSARCFMGVGVNGNGINASTDSAIVFGSGSSINNGSSFSFIGAGNGCGINAGIYCFIGAGNGASITSSSSGCFIGVTTGGNTISASTDAFIGAGYGNQIQSGANFASILNGKNNRTTAQYSSVSGQDGYARMYGQEVRSAVSFVSQGDNQVSRVILQGSATFGQAFDLLLPVDGYITLENSKSYDISIRIIAVDTTNNIHRGRWSIDVLAHQDNSGNVTIDDVTEISSALTAATDWTVTVDNGTGSYLNIVMNASSTDSTRTRRAVATVEWREISGV